MLAVRKSVDQITGAVSVVRRAFITAALAGLALSLILGIPLAATLVRRLRRLREAALELTHEGPAVEVPVDRARDEVGDLARTLAVMQQRLREQEEARRSFVATASHELRTPLTSLDGMLELLDDDLQAAQPDVEDARALLARARAQSRRLGRLAADLLDLSPAGRQGRAALGAGRARRAQPRGDGRVRARAPRRGRRAACSRTTARRCGRSGIPGASRGSCGSCSTTRCGSARRTRSSRSCSRPVARAS